jgi:hypothetical protein
MIRIGYAGRWIASACLTVWRKEHRIGITFD